MRTKDQTSSDSFEIEERIEETITLTQVSELTSTPVSTLRKWAKDKTFPAFKLPSGAWRITEEDYEDWLVQVKEEEL